MAYIGNNILLDYKLWFKESLLRIDLVFVRNVYMYM